MQCFHYLLAQTHYNKETHEPDPKVLELSRVLANVDEAMTSSLHPRKCKVSTYLQHYNCFLRFFFSVYIRGFGTLNSENIDQFRTVYERHRRGGHPEDVQEHLCLAADLDEHNDDKRGGVGPRQALLRVVLLNA